MEQCLMANTVLNMVKTVSKQCQNGVNTVILRCTRGYTRPFDWNMDPQTPLETCIPTAWSRNLGPETVIFDTRNLS